MDELAVYTLQLQPHPPARKMEGCCREGEQTPALYLGSAWPWWAQWQSRLVLRGADGPVGGREAGVNRLTALQHSSEDGRQADGGL